MDIIAAHRQGLIEQLDVEVAALAGRGGDHLQRAMVLHHLFDHSRGSHSWALSEARRAIRTADGLAAAERQLGRWGWLARGRERARLALGQLAKSLGEEARVRSIAVYRAYRLTSTPALREEAEASFKPALLGLLDQCHAARRAGAILSHEARQELAIESERLAIAAVDRRALGAAWAAIEASALRRTAIRRLGSDALTRKASTDERRGADRVERELLTEAALPAGFRANPAQYFYALQRTLHERRRQQWRHACDQVPDAFELAA